VSIAGQVEVASTKSTTIEKKLYQLLAEIQQFRLISFSKFPSKDYTSYACIIPPEIFPGSAQFGVDRILMYRHDIHTIGCRF
jgi:hypothetical protein